MIQRARSRLVLVAAVLALLAVVGYRVLHSDAVALSEDGTLLMIGLGAFAIALIAGTVAGGKVRSDARDLVEITHDIARDTTRRVVMDPDAPKDDELRELGEWINFLADDATRSHQALAREKLLLSAVAEGLNQGVIAVDDDHRIELLNDAARRMLGVSSTPVGEPLIEVMRVPQAFELIDSPEAAQAEVQLPNGPRTLIRVARKWGGEGRVLLLEDVTAMRRLETVRRDFVANVSHELRTPVAVIRANAETLLAGAANDPVMAPKLIDGLHRNAERLARILADLLDLSRLDAGQYRLERTRVELKPITEQSLTAIGPQAAAKGITVALDIADELAVRADAKALDQILVNLIDNAVKYTNANTTVVVAARLDGDGVRIEVRDNGPGLTEKHRSRMFERFYRADQSRSRDAGGTGLGLSIVKHLTETMGGTVGVEPNEPQGSTFWLRLPRSTT